MNTMLLVSFLKNKKTVLKVKTVFINEMSVIYYLWFLFYRRSGWLTRVVIISTTRWLLPAIVLRGLVAVVALLLWRTVIASALTLLRIIASLLWWIVRVISTSALARLLWRIIIASWLLVGVIVTPTLAGLLRPVTSLLRIIITPMPLLRPVFAIRFFKRI